MRAAIRLAGCGDRLRRSPDAAAHTQHRQYISGVVADTEYAPGKYRVLAPFTIDGLATLWARRSKPRGTDAAALIFLAYFAITCLPADMVSAVASLPASRHRGDAAADHHQLVAAPGRHARARAVCARGAGIARRLDILFAVVLALAAFNRETSVFLVVLFFVAYPMTRARLVRTAVFGLEWLAIYGGLRAGAGRPSTTTTGWRAGTSPTSDCCRRTTTRISRLRLLRAVPVRSAARDRAPARNGGAAVRPARTAGDPLLRRGRVHVLEHHRVAHLPAAVPLVLPAFMFGVVSGEDGPEPGATQPSQS